MFSRLTGGDAQLEKLINKATDSTLMTDNWRYILDVCDYISNNPEEATKLAVKYITLRLDTKDANVLLRTLALTLSVGNNCGSRMKQEIATKSFLYDCLIKKLNDKKLHKTVKYKITEVISQLNDSYKEDPSLKPMADAFKKIKSEYPQFLQQLNNDSSINSFGPSKPAKHEITQQDKAKEEEDFQRVLKLSLQEYEREQSVKKAYLNDKPLPETKPSANKASANVNSGTKTPEDTIASISKVRALYDLISYEPDELSFRKGDVITVIESVYRDWWRGSLPNGKTGIFPLNYVTPIVNKSPQELNQELELESNILTNDLRKVDKLLALLSNNSLNASEDEITQLYNELLPLRPSLAKFIDKYSVRKEELMSLNGQLNNQVKYYNDLVDTQMNQKISHQYIQPQMPYPQYQSTPQMGAPQMAPPQSQYSEPQVQHQYSEPQYMATQHTSTGFGNGANVTGANYPYQYPNQPSYPPSPTNSRHNSQAPQYLNINNFPSVNEL